MRNSYKHRIFPVLKINTKFAIQSYWEFIWPDRIVIERNSFFFLFMTPKLNHVVVKTFHYYYSIYLIMIYLIENTHPEYWIWMINIWKFDHFLLTFLERGFPRDPHGLQVDLGWVIKIQFSTFTTGNVFDWMQKKLNEISPTTTHRRIALNWMILSECNGQSHSCLHLIRYSTSASYQSSTLLWRSLILVLM